MVMALKIQNYFVKINHVKIAYGVFTIAFHLHWSVPGVNLWVWSDSVSLFVSIILFCTRQPEKKCQCYNRNNLDSSSNMYFFHFSQSTTVVPIRERTITLSKRICLETLFWKKNVLIFNRDQCEMFAKMNVKCFLVTKRFNHIL